MLYNYIKIDGAKNIKFVGMILKLRGQESKILQF